VTGTSDGQVFAVEPWSVSEYHLDIEALGRTESVFALSNGHIGLRGNLDEGDPHGIPGTYLNSFFELRPLPHSELAYGYPESGQTLINVTNGKLIRLLVDDEPFDVRYGTLASHRRTLDLRAGTLVRDLEWRSPAGDAVRISSTRLVSLTQRAVAAISYEVTPIEGPLRVVLQSELVANEELPDLGRDPRTAAVLEHPLVSEEYGVSDVDAVMVHRTQRSGLRMAAGMRHVVDGPTNTDVDLWGSDDVCRLTVATRLPEGETLRVVKFLAYGWSSQRTRPALRDQVVAALASARLTGFDGLVNEQRCYLDEFWQHGDVELEGDAEVQQAVRVALFHILQAGARAEQRPIPSKGLTGPGYDGHTFWDTEAFVLPVLVHTKPDAAADVLRWRKLTMPEAIERARELGLEGAAYPWRTIRGKESSGYWPASTCAFHINADISDAVVRYVDATGDQEFEGDVGVDLLVQTARLWRSVGHHDTDGAYRIDGVTGPDEYSAIADNNVFTNLMARANLIAAAEAISRHPERAEDLEVTTEEAASWRDAAADMVVPYDEKLGVHPQSENFTRHAVWDFKGTPPNHYPLLLYYPYFDLYRKQVVKQADLVLALHLRGDDFTQEEKDRDFRYYEALTVRDSSLSASTQAVMAAELGYVELAHDYVAEAALVDLEDRNHNTRDGLHMASLAGAWIGLVEGLGGMRARKGRLSFAPRLPAGISHLAFRVCYRGSCVSVLTDGQTATYRLLEGGPLTVTHHGEPIDLEPGDGDGGDGGDGGVVRPIEPLPPRPRPRQPYGREPRQRGQS